MTTVRLEPRFSQCFRDGLRSHSESNKTKLSYFSYSPLKLAFKGRSFCNFKPLPVPAITASSAVTVTRETSDASVTFQKTFTLKRTHAVEGKISVRLEQREEEENWRLTIGCNLSGKWLLHWGINYSDEIGSEWDQPPPEMRPSGSVPIKGYAVETPLENLSSTSEGKILHEVQINFNTKSSVSAINFVLKDEETGAWYQDKGSDFKVPLMDDLRKDFNIIGTKWPGCVHDIQ